MLPSAGTELLDVLICDLLFDLNSASVPESGQLCPILKMKELVRCRSRFVPIVPRHYRKGERERERERGGGGAKEREREKKREEWRTVRL